MLAGRRRNSQCPQNCYKHLAAMKLYADSAAVGMPMQRGGREVWTGQEGSTEGQVHGRGQGTMQAGSSGVLHVVSCCSANCKCTTLSA
jgi:hypothetical protein